MTEATESQGESTFSFGVEHKLRDQDLLISKLLREKSPSDITNGITYQCYLCISTFIRGANRGGNNRIAGTTATRQRFTLVQVLQSIFIHAQ